MLNLSRLRYSCQHCTLAVAQNYQYGARGRSKVYSIWPQASTYVNTLPQCSLASVGLTQARSHINSYMSGKAQENVRSRGVGLVRFNQFPGLYCIDHILVRNQTAVMGPDFISQPWRKIGRRPGTNTTSRTGNGGFGKKAKRSVR